MGHRVRHGLIALALVCAGHAAPLARAEAGLPWAPEVATLFEHYLADDWETLRAMGRQMLAEQPSEAVRRDVRALIAMTQLRSDDRHSRTEGRAALSELDRRFPGLLDRPECLLAYGIAQRELSETSSALSTLQEAVRGFAAEGRPARQAAAIVELAKAWAVHGEWEFPPAGMDVPVVKSRDAQMKIRLERIAALRKDAVALKGPPETVQQVDLVRADVLARYDRQAEAVAILESIAQEQPVNSAVARAAVELGRRREAEGRWAEALALYDRAATAPSPSDSEPARRAAAAIREPRLELAAPAEVAPDSALNVEVSARNMHSLEFELRRFDPGRWLDERQGRFIESQLPVAGSLVEAHRFADTTDTPFAPVNETVAIDKLPAGAYVAIVRGVSDGDAEITRKRMVVASAAHAAVITGPDQAVAWMPGAAGAGASFWMHGSFVPQRPSFAGGVASFALPPERKLLRDSRWVCLLSSSAGPAICTGELERLDGPDATGPAVAAVAAPAEPTVGSRLSVMGLVVPPTGDAGQLAGREVVVQLRDISDAPKRSVRTRLGPGGAFFAGMDVGPDLAGEALRAVVLLDDRVLQSAYRAVHVNVPADAGPTHRVEIAVPRWVTPGTPLIEGTVSATYPWGVPVSSGALTLDIRPVRLPVNEPRGAAVQVAPFHQRQTLRADGRWDVAIPISDFELPAGPIACLLHAQVSGADHRSEECLRPLIVSDRPVHIWLGWLGKPQVGRSVPILVNWFDPLGRGAASHPHLEVHRAGAAPIALDPVATPLGLRSDEWAPDSPGAAELVATLPLSDGSVIEQHAEIEVAAGDSSGASPLSLSARPLVEDGGVVVEAELRGERKGPVLVLLEAGNPIAAVEVGAGTDAETVHLRAGGRLPERARVHALRFRGDRLEDAASMSVAMNAQRLNSRIELLSDDLGPGQRLPVQVTWSAQPNDDSATVLARLVTSDEIGAVPWIKAPPSDPEHPEGGRIRISSQSSDHIASRSDSESDWLPRETIAALFEGQTQWMDCRRAPAGQAVTLNVPLPNVPSRYELIVALRTDEGLRATARRILDTRESVYLQAEAPPELQIGDRTVCAVVVANDSKRPVAATLELAPGPELRILRLEQFGEGGTVTVAATPSECQVALGPSEHLHLRVHFEAAQAGSGLLTCTLHGDGLRRAATAAYRVEAPPAAPSGSEGISLVRRLFTVELPGGAVAKAAADQYADPFRPTRPEDLSDLERVELAPGQRLRPGQLLLVQDEVRLSQPLAGLRWTQRAPANCFTYQVSDEALRHIGRRMEQRRGGNVYQADDLGVGLHVHEFLLAAVRPGACVLPLPELSSAAVRIPIGDGTDQRVIVEMPTP